MTKRTPTTWLDRNASERQSRCARTRTYKSVCSAATIIGGSLLVAVVALSFGKANDGEHRADRTDTESIGGASGELRRTEPKVGLYPTVEQLMAMTDDALERVDPLVINLAVARGVPEFAELDVARYVDTLDAWAEEIRFDTARHRYRFAANPERFHHSEIEYRITWLASDVNAVFKVDYDISDFDAADPSNLFLNGVIDRKLGTCVSMPMLYVALGWRLRYPIKPVAVPTHLFARWDEGQTHVNIEATGYGADNPDSLYESEYFVSDAMKARGHLLQSLTPRRALAVLLLARADYWSRHGDHDRRLADVFRANVLYPEYPLAIIELERAWLARAKHVSYYADAVVDFDRAVKRINDRFLATRDQPIEKLVFDENGSRRVLVDPNTGKETPIE